MKHSAITSSVMHFLLITSSFPMNCDAIDSLYFFRLGDVTRVRLFETWSANSKRDLILLRELAKRGEAVPQ